MSTALYYKVLYSLVSYLSLKWTEFNSNFKSMKGTSYIQILKNWVIFRDLYCYTCIKFHFRRCQRKKFTAFSLRCFAVVLKTRNISICNVLILPPWWGNLKMDEYISGWRKELLFIASSMWVVIPFGPDLLNTTPRNPCK